jgi:hypothetical protein
MARETQAAYTLLLLIGLSTLAFAQGSELSQYYPLSKGNSWKYQVSTGSKSERKTVEWRVTSADNTKEGTIYQVWPFPSDSDDGAMSLRMSAQGLEDSSSVIIPKTPIFAGKRWQTAESGHHRTFRVLSVGHPCQAGQITSDDCLSIEDEDDALRFRTVTTYAKGIGPVRYVYYLKNGPSKQPIQTVELLSYHLDSR